VSAYDEAEDMARRARERKAAPTTGLFEVRFPAPSGPAPASEAAADHLTMTRRGKDKRARQALRVLELIASRESGFTIDEIDSALNIGSGSACARIDDLRTMGYIDTSTTVFRKTRRGRNAAVQFATIKGRARLKEAAP
jgi:hypothetical protein